MRLQRKRPRTAWRKGHEETAPEHMINRYRVWTWLTAGWLWATSVVAPASAAPYAPTWDSVNRHNPNGTAPDWLRDGKFGIYFHWGAYSVPAFQATAFGEWYPKTMNTPGTGENRHHKEAYGDPSEWPYHYFINGAKAKAGGWVKFEPKLQSAGGKFDPDGWAQLFAAAGARFAGPCAEHHDGYSMWASQKNEWNTQSKIGLDVVGEIAAAVRKKGLRLVTSFHHAFPIVWGWYPTNELTYWPAKCIPSGEVSLQKLYGKLPRDEEMQLWQDKLEEVIDAYQPDFIFHDVGIIAVPERYRLNHLAYYYNRAAEWKKDVVVSFKNEELNRDCAVLDFEGGATDDIASFFWVCDQNLGPGSWGYVEGMDYFPAKTVLHSLITIVSKNGCLLLNLSPKADGTIPSRQKDILLSLGRWLDSFGECIYDTRPWATYGEGPAHTVGGVKECGPKDIRFTRSKSNTVLYAIVCGWPGDGAQINLASLQQTNLDLRTLAKVELLGETAGTGIPLRWRQDASGLKVTLPAAKPYSAAAYPIKLAFSGRIPPAPVLTLPPLFSTSSKKAGADIRQGQGEYRTAQLRAAGIPDKSITALKVNAGWTVQLFEEDNFRGRSVTCTAMVRVLSCSEFRFDRKTSSLKVTKAARAMDLP
jgi:alpha-L-fucosidase